ncbi:Bax inhibitor-1/YccA family protein [Marisediminicola sp. LYQ134]|uniref:Bax inhibitor-1/YccA family protein n=1 Tax=unclassified Marisediminicola TaxID=2618316 RepID=UPI003983113A
MASSNPAFTNSPAFSNKPGTSAQLFQPQAAATLSAGQLDDLYNRPSAGPSETDRMTYEDTIVKTVVSFGILLVGAAIGWIFPVLAIPAAIAGFVLALVNIFKKKPSPALILTYAAAQGVFVGGISNIFETAYNGVVPQAILGTLVVVGVVLALFTSGKIRASKKATKVFIVAMVGYLVFSLLNLGLTAFGVLDGFGLREGPFGVIIGIFVILLASYSLVLDFDTVKTGVERGAPRVFGWSAAFGIMVTVVWLYVEILRLLAIFRE